MSKISSRGAMEVLVRCVLPVGFAAALSIIMLAPASAASTGVSHKAVAASAVAMSAQLPLLIAILVAVVSAITVAARCLRRGGLRSHPGW